MSQQKKLEKVLDLLVNEDTDRATELLHQIIVEKARSIYESIVDEEDAEEDDIEDEGDDVGASGDEGDDFTDEIKDDETDIETDELNDGEADDEFADEFADEDSDEDERVDDLEDQLAQLRAEFDALMAGESEEPEHADEFDSGELSLGDEGDDFTDDTLVDSMYESKTKRKVPDEKFEKMTKQSKKDAEDRKHKKSKVDEETQFTTKVADTGQTSKSPGFAGTGKNTPKGAEQDKSTFTNAPSKPNYGGKPSALGKGTGGEYGAYNGDSATDDTPSDNVDEKQKSVATPGNSDKWTGTGKESGSFGSQQKKSPLSKAPSKPM